MAEKRTMSMELRALRQQMAESPPPPPAGATVREWFAGLALMNPTLMHGLTAEERVQEAVRLADELVKALASPRTPTLESMAAPSEKEIAEWEQQIESNREVKTRQSRDTAPEGLKRKGTAAYDFGLSPPRSSLPPPPPAAIHFKRASDHLSRATKTSMPAFSPEAGRYSSLGEPPNDDE